MASDITLVILDPKTCAVVRTRWLGMGETRDKARAVLARPPTVSHVGFESWGDVAPEDAIAIADTSYADGAGPDVVRGDSLEFPAPYYWWILEHEF